MSADEMTVDPAFDYNADLAQVSNVHIAKQIIAVQSHARSATTRRGASSCRRAA